MNRKEMAIRDAVLHAVDALVYHELGETWSHENHSARKRELLDIIDAGRMSPSDATRSDSKLRFPERGTGAALRGRSGGRSASKRSRGKNI